MGNRAVYCLTESGTETYFYTQYGANALSPLLRLSQAMEIQKSVAQNRSIAYIFEHMDQMGNCQEKHLTDADMCFERIWPDQVKTYKENYAKGSCLEMWISLDLDQNQCLLEYNPNCPWYRTMGSYSIDLAQGLKNVQRLLQYGEEHGITEFYRLLTIYHNSTGLAEKLEDARGDMRLSEYMDSSQAREQRQKYQELLEQQERAEREQEEMEER